MFKKFFTAIFLFVILAGFSACGSGTPGVDIPAPVSHLSISSPDTAGNVRVTGEAGFAGAGTTVSVTNPNVTSSVIPQWLVRSAWAHATHTATVAADGSFQLEIEGAVGDTLTITYTSGGVESSEDQVIPDNVPPLPSTSDIQDVSADPNSRTALVAANDGTDGFVHFVNLATMQYSSTLTLAGASSATRLATDPTTGETIVIDTTNDLAIHVSASSGSVVSTTDIIGSSDVAAGPSGGYVIIAQRVS